MGMICIGRRVMSFTDRETRRQINGVKLFFTYTDKDVIGLASDAKFFGSDSSLYMAAASIGVGDEFHFDFTPKGGISGVVFDRSARDIAAADSVERKIASDE